MTVTFNEFEGAAALLMDEYVRRIRSKYIVTSATASSRRLPWRSSVKADIVQFVEAAIVQLVPSITTPPRVCVII